MKIDVSKLTKKNLGRALQYYKMRDLDAVAQYFNINKRTLKSNLIEFESETNQKIFTDTSNGFHFSPKALQFMETLIATFKHYETLFEEVKNGMLNYQRQLKVICPPKYSDYVLTFLQDFVQEHGLILDVYSSFELLSAGPKNAAGWVEEHDFIMSLIPLNITNQWDWSLAYEGFHPLQFYAKKAYLSQLKLPINLDNLQEHPLFVDTINMTNTLPVYKSSNFVKNLYIENDLSADSVFTNMELADTYGGIILIPLKLTQQLLDDNYVCPIEEYYVKSEKIYLYKKLRIPALYNKVLTKLTCDLIETFKVY